MLKVKDQDGVEPLYAAPKAIDLMDIRVSGSRVQSTVADSSTFRAQLPRTRGASTVQGLVHKVKITDSNRL